VQVFDVFTNHLDIAINQSVSWDGSGRGDTAAAAADDDDGDDDDNDSAPQAADCLKLNFQGNAHLDKNEVDQAIECYDKVRPDLAWWHTRPHPAMSCLTG
jgi:hypothetical protein